MNRQQQRGFTLIELMIAVAIVAILASIAYPAYQDQMRKARRSAAQQFVLDIAGKQEQYLLDARQYTDTLGAGGLNLTTPNDVSPYYNIGIAGAPGSYTITATATGSQASDGNLTLNNLGEKTGKW